MVPKIQSHLDTRSRNNSLPPVLITKAVVESPTLGVPTADSSLAAGDGLEAGLEIHNAHERGLEAFRSTFNKNMRNKPVKHDHVHVLIWTWGEEIDDLNVKEEVDRLEQVFSDGYGFSVQREKLNRLKNASHQLNSYLSTFMHKHDYENTLLIFYYAGHGTLNDRSLVMVGTTAQQTDEEKRQNNIAWSSAEKNIKATQADVFVIFDCCFAGGFGGYEFRAAGDTAFQCLAACGDDERTKRPGENSFTSALIWALEELRRCHPFTSKALLEKVKQYGKLPKDQHPKLLRRDEHNGELVWIAPQILQVNEPAPKGERRDVEHEHLDLRFKFWRSIKNRDAEIFAKHMSHLVNDVEDFQAKRIVVLNKTSVHSQALRTISSPVHARRKKSTSSQGRNRSPTVVFESATASPALLELDTTCLPVSKMPPPSTPKLRQLVRLDPEPESVVYHLRMALHYMLQRIKSQIGQLAERILPVYKSDSRLSDVD